MQTYSPFSEIAGIKHAMHRVFRINCARVGRIHLNGIRCFQLARSSFDILL
jgi:hypothetical protein